MLGKEGPRSALQSLHVAVEDPAAMSAEDSKEILDACLLNLSIKSLTLRDSWEYVLCVCGQRNSYETAEIIIFARVPSSV